MSGDAAIVRLLRRDRVVVTTALLSAVAVAWADLLLRAGPAASRAMGRSMMPMPWTLATFGVMALMWLAMMVAMMLPSAAPMILLFAAIDRKQAAAASSYGATGLFALAYLIVWAGFSIIATAAQSGLQQAALLSPAMAAASTALAGTLLLLAGVYQLTPLKQACLRQCRTPLEFLTRYWHSGPLGAFAMGLRHGLYCVGCCWAVMALLFVGGVMNMIWVAGLALFVLVEKLLPAGGLLGRAGGIALLLWGGATLLFVIA